MDSHVEFDFEAPSTGFCQCTAINSQIIAEVESVKNGMEASILRLEEALTKLQSEIPALVEEAVKAQFRATIPELIQALTVMKEGQTIMIPQVEEASRAAFSPLAQSLPHPFTTRASPEQDESSNLHLKFVGNLPEPKSLFTKEDIKDQGASLKVELHDQFGNKVGAGPESSAKIEIFVVDGDFKIKDGDEDMSKHAVTPREGKPPLLTGKSEISLCKGVASVGEFAFTDNSTPTRNKLFRLGAQVVKGDSPEVSIKAAVSDAFRVKEHRNTFYKKPPRSLSLDDEVWHLIYIGKGKTHKKLEDKGIHLVKDLLHLFNTDFNELLQIFRGDKKKLKKTIEMAKSCAESALPIQSQMIPDNSQMVHTPVSDCQVRVLIQVLDSHMPQLLRYKAYKYLPKTQLGETSKQIEQTHIPPMTNLTTDEAESSCSMALSSIMALWKTMDSFQGEPAMQPDGVTHDILRELGLQTPSCIAFENQEERPEFYGAASNILHLNATGTDQGVISYQAGEATFNLPEFQSGYITVDDYIDKASCKELRYRRRWRVVRAVLRFRVAVKVPAKEGPRAGKRQRLS